MQDEMTHTGWMLFCPVFVGNMGSDGPIVVARHWSLTPLLIVALAVVMAGCALQELAGFEPLFPVKLTGRIKVNV